MMAETRHQMIQVRKSLQDKKIQKRMEGIQEIDENDSDE